MIAIIAVVFLAMMAMFCFTVIWLADADYRHRTRYQRMRQVLDFAEQLALENQYLDPYTAPPLLAEIRKARTEIKEIG